MSQWQWHYRPPGPMTTGPEATSPRPSPVRHRDDDYLLELVLQVHQLLLRDVDVAQIERLDPDHAHAAVEMAARALLGEVAPHVVGELRDEVVTAVVNEVLGYGPIDPLIRDPSVSEVMVNGPAKCISSAMASYTSVMCVFATTPTSCASPSASSPP
jgi:Flp pilus assembly protein, ATPase CpaF